MKQTVLLLVLACLSIACEQQVISNKNSSQTEYTDSTPLNVGNYHLKFNSFGLFDTVYNSLQQNMCYPASRYITYSHSDYLNIDTLFGMYKISADDSMMTLNITQDWFKTDRTLDGEFLENEIAKQDAAIRALKSNNKLHIKNLVCYQNTPVLYFAYLDTVATPHQSVLWKSITIVDSIQFSLYFNSVCHNARKKLNEFDRVFRSMRIYTK